MRKKSPAAKQKYKHNAYKDPGTSYRPWSSKMLRGPFIHVLPFSSTLALTMSNKPHLEYQEWTESNNR